MKPTNSIYIGGPLLDPPDALFFCPKCECEFDQPKDQTKCPSCGAVVLDDPEDLI